MRRLLAITAMAFCASASLASVASADNPTRTDRINQRFNGKTYKGTVKYPWPSAWKTVMTAPSGTHYYKEALSMGGGCTARVWTDNLLIAATESQRDWAVRSILASGSGWLLPRSPYDEISLGFGVAGSDVWFAYESNLVINYGETLVPNRWFIDGESEVKLAPNRYLRHRVWTHFFGTCTPAQRTTSPTAQALISALRGTKVAVSLR